MALPVARAAGRHSRRRLSRGPPERARSHRPQRDAVRARAVGAKSLLSKALELGLYAAFAGFFITFATWWGLVPLAGGIAAFFLGDYLDAQPPLRDWVRERTATADADWVSMPREVGESTSTANQLIALCGLSKTAQYVFGYRVLPDDEVELALRRNGGFDIFTLDPLGELALARCVDLELRTWRQLRKSDGGPAWQFVRTDAPPSADA